MIGTEERSYMIGKMTKTEQPEVPFAWALDDCSNGEKK